MEDLGDMGHLESRSVRLEMVLVLVQDRSFDPFGDGVSISAR